MKKSLNWQKEFLISYEPLISYPLKFESFRWSMSHRNTVELCNSCCSYLRHIAYLVLVGERKYDNIPKCVFYITFSVISCIFGNSESSRHSLTILEMTRTCWPYVKANDRVYNLRVGFAVVNYLICEIFQDHTMGKRAVVCGNGIVNDSRKTAKTN